MKYELAQSMALLAAFAAHPLLTTGCSSQSEESVDDDVQLAIRQCPNNTVGKPVRLNESRRSFAEILCEPEGRVIGWQDDQGRTVSVATALREGHRMARARQREESMQIVGPRDNTLVDVWFDVNSAQSPSEGADRAYSPDDAEETMLALGAEIRATREALVESVQAIPGVSVLVNQQDMAPILKLSVTRQALAQVWDVPGVVNVVPAIDGVPEGNEHQSGNQNATTWPIEENYIAVTHVDDLMGAVGTSSSWDGDGIKVAVLGGGRFDTGTNLNVVSGNCGDGYACACPAATEGNTHSRSTAGFISNKVTVAHGTARNSKLLCANIASSIDSCGWTNAANWLVQEGASVVNRSAGNLGSRALFLDWYTNTYRLLFVTSAGNGGNTAAVEQEMRNALVVGGAQSKYSPNPADVVMWSGSSAANRVSGWELPHVVALTHGQTADDRSGQQQQSGDGTSFAAPQVAGIAAGILEGNPNLKAYPEALIAGILVGARENVDGVWPLSLSDNVDDKDGVGLVHAKLSARALKQSARVYPGNGSTEYGHNYGTANSGAQFTYYADVDPGQTLRVAAVTFAVPSCGSPPDTDNCSSARFARLRIMIKSPGAGTSNAASQNYQYIAWKNNTTTTRSVPMELQVIDMDGLKSAPYGIAWHTHD